MPDREISFADYNPREVPDALPRQIWAYWDICGEFMEATEDRAKGEAWLASRAGFIRRYPLDAENPHA
jgi:hypothetical protein